eukprot:scaffold14658_cov67-Phaeocystis_antarctica.AAC.7
MYNQTLHVRAPSLEGELEAARLLHLDQLHVEAERRVGGDSAGRHRAVGELGGDGELGARAGLHQGQPCVRGAVGSAAGGTRCSGSRVEAGRELEPGESRAGAGRELGGSWAARRRTLLPALDDLVQHELGRLAAVARGVEDGAIRQRTCQGSTVLRALGGARQLRRARAGCAAPTPDSVLRAPGASAAARRKGADAAEAATLATSRLSWASTSAAFGGRKTFQAR